MRLLDPTLGEWKSAGSGERDIAALMSGGVDSSVTALLLKRGGWNVVGVTMNIPVAHGCDVKRSCCGMEAAYVCRDLGIPHYYVEVADEFNTIVVEPFRRAYLDGITPSPCVDCNTLKFGPVWDTVRETLGIRNVATGHYARVVDCDGASCLARAADLSRDQSYFLCELPRERLPNLRLPLGGLTKTEVRRLAREASLPVARRQDSMELCFAGEGDYRGALGAIDQPPGPILDPDGSEIGRHNGIANYTVGQRKGIGIPAREPLFVWKIDPAANSITVAGRDRLFESTVSAACLNLLSPYPPALGDRLLGKIRSQGDPDPCEVVEANGASITVRFDNPQFAPTAGQRLVLYDELGRVVGGGPIASQ